MTKVTLIRDFTPIAPSVDENNTPLPTASLIVQDPKMISVGTQTDEMIERVLNANPARFKSKEQRSPTLVGRLFTPVKEAGQFLTAKRTQKAVITDISIAVISGLVISLISGIGITLYQLVKDSETIKNASTLLQEKCWEHLGICSPPEPPPFSLFAWMRLS